LDQPIRTVTFAEGSGMDHTQNFNS